MALHLKLGRSLVLVAGRKLLLADDSVTIQKVVDLTFTDEGLEVVAVGDGQQALDMLEEFAPDVVLADVFMPRMNGYELCERIKRMDRFSHIPVMLLVGSFEPFNEAEARRVGADDYLTKPFQSIRTLISKVRNLLSGGGSAQKSEAPTQRLAPPVEAEKENRPDTDFLERSTADTAPLPDAHAPDHSKHSREVSFADLSMDDEMIEATKASDYSNSAQSRQTVQYSAADLKDAGISEAPESERAPEPAPVRATVGAFASTQASEQQQHAAAVNPAQAPPQSSAVASSEDALLDLGEFQSPSASTEEADDFFLDLFDETPQPSTPQSFEPNQAQPSVETSSPAVEASAISTVEETAEPQAQEFVEGQVLGVEEEPAPAEAEAATFAEATSSALEAQASAQQAHPSEAYAAPTKRLPEDYKVEEAPSTSAISEPGHEAQASESSQARAGQITLEQLSPEVIDAIARRAVEQLSERVVEQIAWEVVPALAELLIKRRLEEEKK